MACTVVSDSAKSFRKVPKLGGHRITVRCDGVGDLIAHLDAASLYRQGNNLGVSFQYEGAGSVAISGSNLPIKSKTSSNAANQSLPWSTVGNLAANGDTVVDNVMRSSLRFTFVGAGSVHMVCA